MLWHGLCFFQQVKSTCWRSGIARWPVCLSCASRSSGISTTKPGLPHSARLCSGPVPRCRAAGSTCPGPTELCSASPAPRASPPASWAPTASLSTAVLLSEFQPPASSGAPLVFRPSPLSTACPSSVWGPFYFFLVIFTLKCATLWFPQELHVTAVLSLWAVSFSVGALQNFPSPFVSGFYWNIVLCW